LLCFVNLKAHFNLHTLANIAYLGVQTPAEISRGKKRRGNFLRENAVGRNAVGKCRGKKRCGKMPRKISRGTFSCESIFKLTLKVFDFKAFASLV
jgi:hypothetical protein